MEWFRRNDGTAVRVGEGWKKVLFVRDHNGIKSVSWSLKTEERERKNTATKTWDNMDEEGWAEVRRVLEGLEGGRELVEGMANF